MLDSAISPLIFIGDGKGKTAASLVKVMRALDLGIRVKIIQFIKADDSTREIVFSQNVL